MMEDIVELADSAYNLGGRFAFGAVWFVIVALALFKLHRHLRAVPPAEENGTDP
jgi:hypothetical protein